jgi:hypothetical protein
MTTSVPSTPVVVGFSGDATNPLMLGVLEPNPAGTPVFHPTLAYGYRDELEGTAGLVQLFEKFLNHQASHQAYLYPLQAFAAEYYRHPVELLWATKPGFHDFELPGYGRVQLRA